MFYNARIQSFLLSKQWFGFDLDDTLHEFRKASSMASRAVFDAITLQHPEVLSQDLKVTYKDILDHATANAFIDGRTSTDYRRERFTLLLQAHRLDHETTSSTIFDEVESLLHIYKSTLKLSLAIKPGAMNLFKYLSRLGKKIIIVTEGPADAQEWTVRELGLLPYVDVLVTTNEVGKSKLEGLFSTVLQKYSIDAADIVYFGDNPIRDIEAARKEGIVAILYDEKQERQLADFGSLRIESWDALRSIITSTQ